MYMNKPFLGWALFAATFAAPLLPSQDPFYTQPTNISLYSPGDLINKRATSLDIAGILPSSTALESLQSAWQYLYRSTDSLGNPVAAIATLLIPRSGDPTKLLAYQTAYDSANNDCSPSYGLQDGSNTTDPSDIAFVLAALDRGWYVVTSDYEGLGAQYTAGLQSGYATLDSVRATLKDACNSGLDPSARYVMWGYSGGALASEWAAELQPAYAPELDFQGVAIGGLVPNTLSVLSTINKGMAAGLAFSGLYGLTKAYPDAVKYLQQQLVPSKSAEFFLAANGCLSQASVTGANKDLFSYFNDGENFVKNPAIQTALTVGGTMGWHGVPRAPLYVYKAVGDDVSPSADTDALVASYCAQGATIEYQRDIVGKHVSESVAGAPGAIAWLADRLDGTQVVNIGHCITGDVAHSPPDLGAFAGLGSAVVALLQSRL